MKVKDIMTKSLVRTESSQTLKETSRFLLKHHLNSMPVLDKDGRLLGIITQADIYRAVLPSYDEIYKRETYLGFDEIEQRANDAAQRKVGEVISRSVLTVEEDTPVVEAGSMLLQKGIKQLPVVRKEKVVVMVTLTDVIESLIISTPKK